MPQNPIGRRARRGSFVSAGQRAVVGLAACGFALSSCTFTEGACVWFRGGTVGCNEVAAESCAENDAFMVQGATCADIGYPETCETDDLSYSCASASKDQTYSVSYTGDWADGEGGPDPYDPGNVRAGLGVVQDGAVVIHMQRSFGSAILWVLSFDDGSIVAQAEGEDGAATVHFQAKGGESFFIVSGYDYGGLFDFDVTAQITQPYEEQAPIVVTPKFAAASFDACLSQHEGCLTLGLRDACYPPPCPESFLDPILDAGQHPYDGVYDISWGPSTCSKDTMVYQGTGTMTVDESIVTFTGLATSDVPTGTVGEGGVLDFPATPGTEPEGIEGTIQISGVSGTYPANCTENGVPYETISVPYTGEKQEP